MNTEIWRNLLGLESIDLVTRWHKDLFDRSLSSSRAHEVTAAARQAREYFRNALTASDVVRPLLTFYGVASLARATVLLLRPGTGEASLVRGHGLETQDWPATLSGDLSSALSSIGSLRIRSGGGLFSDFLAQTNNRVCMHVRSARVDWQLDYAIPPAGEELTLVDLLSRLPDLKERLVEAGIQPNVAWVNEVAYTDAGGFSAKVLSEQAIAFTAEYESVGYAFKTVGAYSDMTSGFQTFQAATPQFVHSYVSKTFGSIPALHLARPLPKGTRLSQLGMTYAISYFLGMLTRYFPTHWVALQSGVKGDALWPTIRASQEYVEVAFPELVLELIQNRLSERKNSTD
jgi:hypothetical protein